MLISTILVKPILKNKRAVNFNPIMNQTIEEDFQKEDTLKNPQPVEKWKILNKK